MGPVHISPEDAVRAHEEVGAATSVAIHFGTFHLADDGQDRRPVAELQRALDARKTAPPVLGPRRGRGKGHSLIHSEVGGHYFALVFNFTSFTDSQNVK